MAIERLMGLDIGSHRIGVAIGDELGIVATPVGFVRPGPSDRTAFVDLIRRHQATRLVDQIRICHQAGQTRSGSVFSS